MQIRTEDLNQLATYWPPGGNTGAGKVSYGAPIVIACRWQDIQELVRNAADHVITCSSIVYVDRELVPQGYLVLGDHVSGTDSDGFLSPMEVAEARIIQALGQSPSLDADEVLLKVWL